MSAEIVVPNLGESVSEATVAQWLKQVGDEVKQDEPIVELETDKVTLEVNASSAGVIKEIKVQTGEDVEVGAVLGSIEEGAKGSSKPAEPAKSEEKPAPKAEQKSSDGAANSNDDRLSPAVRKLINDNDLDASQISGSGKDGRLTKEDVLAHLEGGSKPAAKSPAPSKPSAPRSTDNADREERVKMTRLRQKIAERLKGAQDTAAMLTTFNEVDMGNLMALRSDYKDAFQKKHNIKLGFMSFFTKATIQALKEFPAVNAEIDGTDIVYKNYYDIGIAVSTSNGLVVPVVRDADQKSLAQIESDIADYGKRAGEGKLAVDEMTGGTFTITNGGVFGSLMSTPILNAPQSGILGMHTIQQRPVAVTGQVEIRPMMYIALSYDHRIIDGREAVSFLVRIKQNIEDPQRLLLDV